MNQRILICKFSICNAVTDEKLLYQCIEIEKVMTNEEFCFVFCFAMPGLCLFSVIITRLMNLKYKK